MKLLYSFSALLLCFNTLIAQFYSPTNPSFTQQWQHQVNENIPLDSRRAWYLSPSKGSDVNIFIIDDGLYTKLSSINSQRVTNIFDFDHNTSTVAPTANPYANIELPDEEQDFYFHGDQALTLGFGSHNLNNSKLAGTAPNSSINLCRLLNPDASTLFETGKEVKYCLDYLNSNEQLKSGTDINLFGYSQLNYSEEIRSTIIKLSNENILTIFPINDCNTNPGEGYDLYDGNPSLYRITAGMVNIQGEIPSVINYNSSGLDLLAPGMSLLILDDDEVAIYDYPLAGSNFDGECASAVLTAGVAAMIISEMKDDPDGQDRDQRAWVKKMMTTTAEKIGTGFDDLRLPPRDIQDKMQKNEYSETTQRNNTHGHGFLNAHQSILLTKTFVLDQDDYIYTPIPVETTQPQIMSWDQVMFDDNHNKRYAMALNRDKISTYHLPQSRDDVNDMGGVFYDIILDHLPNVNNFQDHYMQSIQLEGPNFDFITHANNRAARVLIPFSQTRRLSEEILTPLPYQDHRQLQCRTNFPVLSFLPGFGNARPINSACVTTVSAAGEDLKIEIRNGIVECKNTTYDSDYSAAVEECINEIDGITDIIKAENNEQYFHLAKSDDPNGKYKKGDLVVSRKIKGKWKVVWASRTNDILSSEDHDLFLHRDITDKISYDVYGEVVTESNDLNDTNYMHDGDAGRRLLHHNGRLGVVEKNDQGTLDENDDIWREIKMLTDHQDLGHSAHRLLMDNGVLQFVGGSESDGVFTSEQVLKTFGEECPNTDYSTHTNPKFDFVKDGRSLAYFNDEIPIFLIDVSNTTNRSLATNQKLISINQQPNIENGNEVNSIISEDGTKASIIMDGKLKVVPLQNGVFCINNPIQTFDLD